MKNVRIQTVIILLFSVIILFLGSILLSIVYEFKTASIAITLIAFMFNILFAYLIIRSVNNKIRSLTADAEEKVDFLNKIPTPVMVVDKQFQVRFVNSTVAQVLKMSPEQCIGQKCYNLFKTPHCNTPECRVGRAMNLDNVFIGDTFANLPIGQLPIRYSGAPLKDINGNINGAIEYVLDISKEMEITKNLSELTNSILAGKLDDRAKEEMFEGNYRQIVEGVNKILSAVITPLKTAAIFVERISKGDIPDKIQGDYKGEFKDIISNLNLLIDSMNQIVHTAQSLANGDITVTITPRSDKDSLMIALSTMIKDFNQIIGNVLSIAEQVSSGSQTLSSTAQELSSSTNTQASSAEEIAASMEEMNANIEQNASNAKATENIAISTSEEAVKGGAAVDKTVTAMKEIADKISIISEITRQTNMLALNAAIEAARAGEHGKGFAVVADAVRKLAERSQAAAASINELSNSSIKIAEEAGSMLQKIVPNIRRTAELVQEISAASNEQKTGGIQVNKAIQQLDQIVQQNAAVAEEMSSTSEELAAQAEYLKDAVSFFKIVKEDKRTDRFEREETSKVHFKKEKSKKEMLLTMDAKTQKRDFLDKDFEKY
ncbi:MAG: PAS domain-containing protein [Desulfobacterales bacterium]|nr:PAS domain-containing protein [Desulfobacterales bacterium]MBF0395387.1 PAS domain-containing protein [Desulfobacterales bacterium]